MTALAAFARNDVRGIVRDPFLVLILAGPPALVALQRFAAPPLADQLGAAGVDVTAHLPVLPGFLLCMLVPHLFGALIGLMLLEERDAGTLVAVRVTPVALGPFVGYRAALATTASLVAVAAGLPLTGLVTVSAAGLASSALLAGLLGAFTALLLPAFASNQVEGLAALKAAGLPLLLPVGAWFVEAPWQHAFGVIPTYWPAAALWAADGGAAPWPYLLVGAVYLGGLTALLWRRLRARVERA